MKRTILLVAVCVLWTSTAFSQYFSKTYIYKDNIGSFISNVFCKDDNHCVKLDLVVSDQGRGCIELAGFDQKGMITWKKLKPYFNGNQNALILRHDTIFYSGRSNELKDSIMYWYFGMMSIDGDSIAEYKYATLHLKDTGIGSFGYQTPTNYGLTLVNNNEVILWGEGLDKRMPQPLPPAIEVPFRSVFLRVGMDGERKSDLFWFEMSENPDRRMSDAATDIDGNMVFVYEWAYPFVSAEYNSLRKGIFKIMPDNSIESVAEVPIGYLRGGRPRMAIDSLGNYIINPTIQGGGSDEYNVNYSDLGFLSKIDRSGEVLWTSLVPPAFKNDWIKELYSYRTQEMTRISTTKNGDILCTGRIFTVDSIDIPGSSKKKWISGNGCYIARFNTDGQLLWQHFIVPLKKDTTIRYNAIFDIKEAPDGSIVTGGLLENYDGGFRNDAWLMRLTPGGCLDADCSHVGKYWVFPEDISTVQDEPVRRLHSVTVSPNPGRDKVSVRLSEDATYPLHYGVQSITGIRYITGTLATPSDTDIDMSWLPSGMYIIYIRDHAGQTGSVKWIRE